MTSRERMLRALEFRGPDRIPLAAGDDADIGWVGYRMANDFVPERPGMTEWGCVWVSLNPKEGDQGQVQEHPLSDWEKIHEFRFPDPFAPGRMAGVADRINALHRAGKFVCAMLGKGPMHLLDDLRGFEAYLMDLMMEPERTELLLDGVFRFLSGLTEQFADLGADAVFLVDDQAMQTGPLFSMDIWRELFGPRYRALCTLAHEMGCKVHMHACGNLSQHLTELVDVGIDVIDNKQPALWMHSPAVDKVRGRVSFSTCVDIQSVIGAIDIDRIPDEVARLIHRLSVPAGGFIGTFYGKPDLHIPPEKNGKMLEAFRAFTWGVMKDRYEVEQAGCSQRLTAVRDQQLSGQLSQRMKYL